MAEISKIKINDVTYDLKDSSARSSMAVMTGASDTANGAAGMAPTPLAGENLKFLRGDGSWEEYAPITYDLVLTTAGWVGNNQSVTAVGVTPSNVVIISPAPISIDAYTEATISCLTQGNGSLIFTCETTPTTAITVNAVVFTTNSGNGSSG